MADEAPIDVKAAFKADVEAAVAFIDSDIGPIREAATRYYNAEPFGDEEEGRSRIVTPVVRDVVKATLPSLMRVFFGGQRVVEFTGTNGLSAEIADDMTEAVHHVFMRQNPGFNICWAAFKDALVRKVGFIEWYWDESVAINARVFSGVSEDQLAELNASPRPDEQLEVLEQEQVGELPGQPIPDPRNPTQPLIDPATGQPAMSPPTPVMEFKVRLVTRKKKKQVKVCAVPPEEIIVSKDATSFYDARLVARRQLKTVGELRAMGIPQELLEGAASAGGNALDFNQEKQARSNDSTQGASVSETPDQRKVLYISAFYRVDQDGDGIPELRRICTVGDDYVETHNEYTDEVNLAGFCPDPEPHTPWGLSQADNVADLQNIESHVNRDLFDSLKASIFPRMAYVEGQANVDDVLNTEIGGAIRMRVQGAVQPIAVPFLGQQAFPVIEHLQNQRESRTGIGRNSGALDARALQSTNQIAVNAAVTAAQSQPEMIARLFAEDGMIRVFRGIAKLIVENHSGLFHIPVHGKVKPLDPKKWDLDAEMSIDTGLGVGSNDGKLAVLAGVAQTQATILREMGIDNPLCSLQEAYNTQVKILQYSGFRDHHRYFTNPQETMKEMEPKEPEPTPEQVLAEAEMKIKAGEQNLKRLDLVLTDDRERDQMEMDGMLRVAEMRARYGAQIDTAAIKGAMDAKRDLAKAERDSKIAKK